MDSYCITPGPEHHAHLRRLVASRWIVIGAMAVLVLISPGWLDIPLPQEPLFGILAVLAALNGIVQWRMAGSTTATPYELLSQLLIDLIALSALVFFSGGATNPLVSLLLPPVAIAALTLPGRLVFAVGSVAVIAYSVLMIYYLPLPVPDVTRATRLHLIGMWLTFVISAIMIASFVVRMTRLIRERDAELATAREQGLRDERIMAMATLAAGAAHELGTPLATMSLLAGELANDPALSAEVQQDIGLLRQQIAQCKKIITDLSRRAEAERLENTHQQSADHWLEGICQHWQANRPQASCQMVCRKTGPAPEIVADPRLEQAILNLLNTAANATASQLDITLDWTTDTLTVEIRDHGPGYPPSVLKNGGKTSFPSHARGSGVGLLLTRTALEQLGGKLTLINPDDGGALARIELPLGAA